MNVTDRQGCLTGIFVLIVLLGACVLIVAAIWFALPREEPVEIGQMDDISGNEPLFVPVNSNLAIYLVRDGDGLIAWSALSPRTGCRIRWVPLNNRFEDPCCGGKWCADGSVADLRYRGQETLARYQLEVSPSGRILLFPWSKIEGPPLPDDAWVYSPRDPKAGQVACPEGY